MWEDEKKIYTRYLFGKDFRKYYFCDKTRKVCEIALISIAI